MRDYVKYKIDKKIDSLKADGILITGHSPYPGDFTIDRISQSLSSGYIAGSLNSPAQVLVYEASVVTRYRKHIEYELALYLYTYHTYEELPERQQHLGINSDFFIVFDVIEAREYTINQLIDLN